MQVFVETALGEPIKYLLPVGALRIAGRCVHLAGARGRELADRLLGLTELEPMRDPQAAVLGITCRPLRRLESMHAA
jgi:hypothetical protein